MNDLMLSTPGVAVLEQSAFPQSIAGVATAIPAFIGPVENPTSPDGTTLVGNTWRISSFEDFKFLFGTPTPSTFLIHVDKFVDQEGGLLGTDVRYVNQPERVPTGARLLFHGMDHYFANGGGPCHIRPIDAAATQQDYVDAIRALESIDEITINVILNTIGANAVNYGALVTASLQSCRRMKDRFTIADVFEARPGGAVDNANPSPSLAELVTSEFRDNVTTVAEDELKYGAAYMPDLNTTMPILFDPDTVDIDDASQLITVDAEGNEDGGADLFSGGNDLPLSDGFFQGVIDTVTPANSTPGEKNVEAEVLALLGRTSLIMPPSPAMAGIYARTDRQRGVHVTPANVGVNNITGPALAITDAEQGLLNVDPTSGKSVNAIRAFTGRGTLVWGGRTLAGNSGDWKFINRRRTALYLEESIATALEQFVFQPNEPKTWVRANRMISGFLLNEWRAGTLTGPTAPDAFDVTIGLGTTMTQQDIIDGLMRILVRVAIPGPAEKIILQFTQKAQAA
ncbi:phage tail sheath subtilisin-like domain-containing protein [Tateyamaria sp. syn59]|uniref:phage tail sheath family protein n=1 Tax=Tateyamaria sp. syn59 TaxID=2576942 RepID=UPI0011BF628C|nr:phage tail sheath subtilisin-like domain-containing protein [Tateyamaria sp. syn59]